MQFQDKVVIIIVTDQIINSRLVLYVNLKLNKIAYPYFIFKKRTPLKNQVKSISSVLTLQINENY